jgi:hypothetical protein
LKTLLLSALLAFSMVVLAEIPVRPGIILLFLLDSILNSKAKRAGQVVSARVVQNSPLAEGSTSKTGNTIVGRIIELNATADAPDATTVYRLDELTVHKDHFLILMCSKSVHSSKNAVVVQASPSRQGDCIPQETATTDPIVGGSMAVAEDLLRMFRGYHPYCGLMQIVERAWARSGSQLAPLIARRQLHSFTTCRSTVATSYFDYRLLEEETTNASCVLHHSA